MATTKDIKYEVDGRTMIGRMAIPDGAGPRPAVLIVHEGPGLGDNERRRAERLADLGYVAFALDYHGGGQVIADRDEMMTRLMALAGDPMATRARGQAGLEVLLAEARVDPARVGAIGFCFGGAMVLELARAGHDLKAVIGFHPSLGTMRPDDAVNIRGKVLVCVGTEDPLVPPDQRGAFEAEMRAGGVDWRMNLYGGAQHSFTNPLADSVDMPGIKYDRATDERSWRAMLDLFSETIDVA